ncbi:MAG: polysaccharide ABC transporter ATP-binding protein [Acidobacteria bacterium]|nr:polysaccharide ABC transporter ATP-binding protein [Acidobacteriota bacterium]MCA1610691.1 polysaccharide ABC transporter ATP-binding protein [Acidobacteriota bacterium]
MSAGAIRVRDLGKEFRIGSQRSNYKTIRETVVGLAAAPYRRLVRRGKSRPSGEKVWALKGVSFDVNAGEVVGVIGRNGAGKSTLLKILSRITEPTTGSAEIHGRVGSLLEVGTGFHEELTGRENLFLNGAILGMKRSEILRKFDEIVAFAEIDRFIDTPVKHYSTGMYLRLAFAVAAHLEPEILLVDEVLAVGDVAFQKKCLGKMEDVAKLGRTVLLVSHNMAAVRSLCTRGIVLDAGGLAISGDIGSCVETYFKMIGAFQESSDASAGRTGSAGFGKVSLSGRASKTSNTIHQSEPCEVSTLFRVGTDTAGFQIVCIVEDMQGRIVFRIGHDSQALGLSPVTIGEYELKLTIPALWLNAGLYSLHFRAFLWGDRSSPRYDSDKVPLDVTGGHSEVDSILHPEASWMMVPVVESAVK